MGKRKREYDSIVKKIRKLENKLKRRRRRTSDTSESEYSESRGLPVPGPDFPDDPIPDEILYSEEYIDVNGEDPPAQLETFESAGRSATPPEPDIQPVVEIEDAQGIQSIDNIPPQLEPEILQLLGEDPASQKSYGNNLHKDIAPRWMHILANGLHKDTQSELVKCYLPPENCPNMRAPKLNLEIKAALLENNVKKDMYSQSKQNQFASSLAAIGQVLNWALESKGMVPQHIIKTLSDAGRLICDSHYRESQSRRYAALNTLNKNIRDTIKNTNIDENLFGSDLSEHIKSAKAITRTGSEMRPISRPPYKAPPAPQPPRGALNSRGTPRAAAAEPRLPPAPRRPPRDRRQDAARGRRSTGYTRHQMRKR